MRDEGLRGLVGYDGPLFWVEGCVEDLCGEVGVSFEGRGEEGKVTCAYYLGEKGLIRVHCARGSCADPSRWRGCARLY